MEEKFYSKENFLVLKEIIGKITLDTIDSSDKQNQLFLNMVNIFDNNKNITGNFETDFHNLNKSVINLYSNQYAQIPQKSLQNTSNIFNPIEGVNQNYEEKDANELFSMIKKERESNNNNGDTSKIEDIINSGNDLNEDVFSKMNLGTDNQDINFETSDRGMNLGTDNQDINFETSDRGMNLGTDNQDINFETSDRGINFETNNQDMHLENEKENFMTENQSLHTNDIVSTLNPYTIYDYYIKHKQIEKEIIITIDSKDRDLSVYPHPTNFQVKYGATSDTIEIPTRLGENGVIIHEPATLYKGYQGAVINNTLKNIKSIEIISATIPYISYYYNGNFPIDFNNNNQINGNMPVSESWNNTAADDLGYLNNAYRSLYRKGQPGGVDNQTGIPRDVLDEPYLLLSIDELDNQQTSFSTNMENSKSFARLINDKLLASQLTTAFSIFRTYSEYEGMLFDPTLLSSLDKMTLHLKDQSNNHINFGQDKIYVNQIEENVTQILNKNIDLIAHNSIKITINPIHNDYLQNKSTNNQIEGHCLSPGDVVYFYTTKPCSNKHIYKLNSEQATATLVGNVLTINLTQPSVQADGTKVTNRDIRISQYLFIGDYISINGTLNRIISFTDKTATLDTTMLSATYTDIGFVRQNKRGFTSESQTSLFYKGGHTVCYIDSNTEFTIDLPSDSIIENGLLPYDDTTNPSDSIFFIKKNLQINYMFKFTTVEKDYEQLKSDIL